MRKTSFGTFFELGGRGVMESLARTGLDYVIIDTAYRYGGVFDIVHGLHPDLSGRCLSGYP